MTTDDKLDRMCREDGCPNYAERGQTVCCECVRPKAQRAPADLIAFKVAHEISHGPLGTAATRSVLMPLAGDSRPRVQQRPTQDETYYTGIGGRQRIVSGNPSHNDSNDGT